jgi:hypothetical protein
MRAELTPVQLTEEDLLDPEEREKRAKAMAPLPGARVSGCGLTHAGMPMAVTAFLLVGVQQGMGIHHMRQLLLQPTI